ncbi:MAG TPA: hypothetical protein VJP85_05585 [Candidatus Baltobacteraceae bacterium]|nr:hypothetical protein [Candidatus Baltobacteraceae bacterium]
MVSEDDASRNIAERDERRWYEKSQAALPILAGLPACAYAVFYCILGHVKPGTNTWSMSYAEVERETKISRSSVVRGVRELRQSMLLHTAQQKRERTIFTLHIPEPVSGLTGVGVEHDYGVSVEHGSGVRVDASLVSAHEEPPSTPDPNSQHVPAAAARVSESDLKEAWSKESPSAYPGVRTWSAFVAKKIEKGEMPAKRSNDSHAVLSGTCECCGNRKTGRRVEPSFEDLMQRGDVLPCDRPFFCFGCLELSQHERDRLTRERREKEQQCEWQTEDYAA